MMTDFWWPVLEHCALALLVVAIVAALPTPVGLLLSLCCYLYDRPITRDRGTATRPPCPLGPPL
jgi:hypothetical protein